MPQFAESSLRDAAAEKIHKVLADRHLGSRRKMERWVVDGRVTVNGTPAIVGQRVLPTDIIEVDRKRIPSRQPPRQVRILLMNKIVGDIVSRDDPQRRSSVFTRLPQLQHERWISVGRLDIATSGLLLFTNHGLLAHRLMHPSSGIDREYAVRVFGKLDDQHRESMLNGIDFEGNKLRFSDIRYYSGGRSNHCYHVVLMEGRNREVRHIFQHFGYTISRLKRVRFGPVILPKGLRRGEFSEMSPADVHAVCKWLQIGYEMLPTQHQRSKPIESFLIPYPGIETP